MSLIFQADADLRHAIVKAVRHREPAIDFASAVESNLKSVSDPEVLERASLEGRILVSHDRRTMLAHFREHIAAGKSSPGLYVISQSAPIGSVVDAIVLAWAASEPSEWQDQVFHLRSLIHHIFGR